MSVPTHFARSWCALAVLAQFFAWSSFAIGQDRYIPRTFDPPRQSSDERSPFPTSRYDDPFLPSSPENEFLPQSGQRPSFDARPSYPPNDYQPRRRQANQHPTQVENRSSFPKYDPVEPASFGRIPQRTLSGDSAVKQVSWHEENGCGCACSCKSKACYSGYCGRCSDRWRLFPRSDRLEIGGWIDQGVTFNFHSPSDRSNTRVLFNDRSNDYLLNQVYLYAESPVCADGSHWDIGGRVDVMYGRDSRFVTVPGLERHHDRSPKWNRENGLNGLALPQAYLEIAAPWQNGFSLKVGHFYSTMGYERFAAPDNFFYSHSYSFIFGEPFTFTGALATVKPSDVLTFTAGYTNGWDVWDSSSNEWGILAGARLASPDGRTSLGVQVHHGEDITSVRSGNVFVDETRTAWTLLFRHCLTERLRYVFQHDFGFQEDGRVIANIPTSTISFDSAKWYGINQYLIFEHNERVSSGVRVEWFRDQDKSRTSVPVVFNPGGPVFTGGNYVAVTGGINWRPKSNVIIRPEVRWDWSDLRGNPNVPGGGASVRAFDDGTRSSQVTAALDVIIHY